MNLINFNDIKIQDYEGTGENLIFVHAYPLSNKLWLNQVEFFKNKYRVITYDIRGLGESQFENNQFTMEEYADDLLDIIDFLNLKKTIACGLSIGGYIIQRAYIKNPEKFRAIVLADTKGERDDDNGLISRSLAIKELKKGEKYKYLKEFLMKLLWKKSYENNELREYLEKIMMNQSVNGLCGALLALATRTNTIDNFSEINIPALILCGEYDVLTPIALSENLKRKIRQSELKIIKNAGHLSCIENPDDFNTLLNTFLENIG
jgi:3-oxoadipate enol-lactonase